MTGELFVVVLLALVTVTLIICLPVVLFFWLIARKKSNAPLSANEEDRLRSISQGLQRMEDRIDNLETIIAGKRRRDPLDDAERGEDIRTGKLGSDPPRTSV